MKSWTDIIIESFDGDKIFSQMGGKNKLTSMIGASNFTVNNKSSYAQFQFKGSSLFNTCVIYLTPKDTYNLRLFKLSGTDFKNDKTIKDIQADSLIDVFEKETKLRLSL